MDFGFEKSVPREKAIIFNDRMAVSSRALFQIVREFFEPRFLMHQIDFGDNRCWMGFRTTQTGNEDQGWIKIESGLGVKEPGGDESKLLDFPPITVGSVSIRSLSPIASRVLIRTDYTPVVLSSLFNALAQYLKWVVNGEESHEAWSRAVSGARIMVVSQIDASEVPLLEAPSAATAKTKDIGRPSNEHTTSQKPKRKSYRRKTRKRRRTAKKSIRPHAKKKIFVPKRDYALERYRKMWRIICRTQRAYLHLPNGEEERKPNPTYDDLREAIEEKLRHKPSEKTVRRVILAGTNGLLKKR
ncbi:MAG: hypothetical protein HZB51_26440 [Chloroflexi bacterium]|nr:hypothetical protein [Chloroflexota bacterium]